MSDASLPLAEIKAHLSEVVDRAVHHQSTVITRHGKPVAAIVSVEELERLRVHARSDRREGLAALFGKLRPADEVVRGALAVRSKARRERPRGVPDLRGK